MVYFCNFKETAHSKQLPIGRKFAQSGHPEYRDRQMWLFVLDMPGVEHQPRLMPVALAPQLKVAIWDQSCEHIIRGYKSVSFDFINQHLCYNFGGGCLPITFKNLTILFVRAPPSFCLQPILRLLNLLQRWCCSKLERLFQNEENIFISIGYSRRYV
jgi:hypothetical protein